MPLNLCLLGHWLSGGFVSETFSNFLLPFPDLLSLPRSALSLPCCDLREGNPLDLTRVICHIYIFAWSLIQQRDGGIQTLFPVTPLSSLQLLGYDKGTGVIWGAGGLFAPPRPSNPSDANGCQPREPGGSRWFAQFEEAGIAGNRRPAERIQVDIKRDLVEYGVGPDGVHGAGLQTGSPSLSAP